MVYLLKMVIFHGYVSHNQMVVNQAFDPGDRSVDGWGRLVDPLAFTDTTATRYKNFSWGPRAEQQPAYSIERLRWTKGKVILDVRAPLRIRGSYSILYTIYIYVCVNLLIRYNPIYFIWSNWVFYISLGVWQPLTKWDAPEPKIGDAETKIPCSCFWPTPSYDCESIVRIALLIHSNGEATQNNVFQVYADICWSPRWWWRERKCHTLDTKWVMVLVKEYEWHHSHDFDYCLAAVFYGGIFHMLST